MKKLPIVFLGILILSTCVNAQYLTIEEKKLINRKIDSLQVLINGVVAQLDTGHFSDIKVRLALLRKRKRLSSQLEYQKSKLENDKQSKEINRQLILTEKERTQRLKRKYANSKYLNSILEKSIKLGMTKEMVIDSWGLPTDINKSVGSWGGA